MSTLQNLFFFVARSISLTLKCAFAFFSLYLYFFQDFYLLVSDCDYFFVVSDSGSSSALVTARLTNRANMRACNYNSNNISSYSMVIRKQSNEVPTLMPGALLVCF